MAHVSLRDKCSINTNIDTDTFVGVKAVDGDVSVNFPLGFRLSEDDKGLRKDILLLMNVLSKNTERKDSEINYNPAYNSVKMPVQAYLYIISDYYARGYYREREVSYEVSRNGKINWGRTVKTQRAYLQDDEIYYLDFITKKKNINENELITLIHEFCVYESFDKMGWLFTSAVPPRPNIRFNRRLFHGTVRKKISETFNDRNRQLFINMLAVIDFLGDDGPAGDYRYGTYRFEYVWESMIDKVYGIRDKENYFPKTRWLLGGQLHDNACLEPDTIMLVNGDRSRIYVLDAKYYKYGWTGNPGHLPESTSINKQITYGEYLAENEKFRDENGNSPHVYNAFLMPFSFSNDRFASDDELYYIGSAVSDWKITDGSRPYEQVAGILVDVKTLMKNSSHNEDRILRLAKLIEDKVREYRTGLEYGRQNHAGT